MKGEVRSLRDRALIDAVKALNPVIVLDTAIRFSTADDENSASDNKQLRDGIFGLLRKGAQGVVGIHHAVKASSGKNGSDSRNRATGHGGSGGCL